MRAIQVGAAIYSAVVLWRDPSTATTVVAVLLNLMPLALTAYGKRIARKLAADRKAALDLAAHTRELQRRLDDLKFRTPRTPRP